MKREDSFNSLVGKKEAVSGNEVIRRFSRFSSSLSTMRFQPLLSAALPVLHGLHTKGRFQAGARPGY